MLAFLLYLATSDVDADALRWANVGLAAVVVVLLTAGATMRWRVMPKRLKRIVPWVILTYVIIAYGSGEIAVSTTAVDPGVRVVLMILNLLGLTIALLYGIDDEDYDYQR